MEFIEKRRVGFGPRLVAFVIDSFFIAVLASILMSAFMGPTFTAFIKGQLTETYLGAQAIKDSISSREAYDGIMRISLFIAHFSTLYMITEAFWGASPGKMLLGLKIGTQDGLKGDIWVYFPRFALKNSSVLLDLLSRLTHIAFISSLAGFVGMVIFTGCFFALGIRKQALHDTIARTAVFRKEDLV